MRYTLVITEILTNTYTEVSTIRVTSCTFAMVILLNGSKVLYVLSNIAI